MQLNLKMLSPAGATSLTLLILFLQLLRSTTTSPTSATTLDDSKLPLIVFQHHHHHRLSELHTTELPDYYAYNVADKRSQSGGATKNDDDKNSGIKNDDNKSDEVSEVRKKHFYNKNNNDKSDEISAVRTTREHLYNSADHIKNDEISEVRATRKHHRNKNDSNDDDDVSEIRATRKHHYDISDDDDSDLIRGKKHHSNDFQGKTAMRTLYQVGDSDSSLPVCGPWAVCGKVDVYEPSQPWLEKQCRCPSAASIEGSHQSGANKGSQGGHQCSSLLTAQDGHTIVDKTRHYKVCEPVRRLPRCRYFRDVTWTLLTTAENGTQQTMHCLCPKGAVAYLIKRQAYQTSSNAVGYQYSFACSPQSRLRCQRKEPCRLFTVRKRQELLDEVNTNTLCQCPRGHTCPTRHTHQPGVVQGKTYLEENVRTYSGYCLPN